MRFTRVVFGGPKTPTGFKQDGPPAGGFPAINTRRSLPAGGMSSLAMFAGGSIVMIWGYYKMIMNNRALKTLKMEQHDLELSVLPFLTHESDCKTKYLNEKQLENEKDLMRDVPGWQAGASVYATRYLQPMSVFGFDR
jgi:NADH dehydrogenase (ubiquinone) 1 alpha subcomplex subunit 13